MSSKPKTLATKEEATPPKVPKLRFPEFRGAEAWKVKKLSSSVQLVSGMHLSPEQYGKEGAVPYFTGPSDFTNKIEAITKRTSDSASLAKEDDTLITVKGSGVGEIWYLTLSSVAMGRQLMAVRAIDASSGFVFQFLLTKRRRFEDLAAGNLIPGLARGDILDLEAPFPLLPEQQKIAECLSSVDELMAAQARKVDALKTHKKGLMQQLFPREGEAAPRLRFPEFRDAGEWGDQTVGDFGKVITGSTPSTAKPAFYGGGIPFVSPADISDLRFVDQTKTTLTPEGFAETRPVRSGSVLFVCIGSTIGKVAQSVRDCATNQQINAVVPSSKHSDGFVYFALSLAAERIALLAGRQAVPIINKSLFSSVRMLSPKLPEQQRIAACLSSLDALIAAETRKLEALKTHKKGLMQQLFPSLEEGTA